MQEMNNENGKVWIDIKDNAPNPSEDKIIMVWKPFGPYTSKGVPIRCEWRQSIMANRGWCDITKHIPYVVPVEFQYWYSVEKIDSK